MGLAASQARLLFVTMRQNDVSAQMQRVSNDTMVLARDKDIIAENYENMLNKKSYKLVDGVDLSYNSLMGAGAAQNGTLGVITDTAGRVVLTSDLASSLNLDATSGTGADFKAKTGCSSRVAFVSKMMGISEDVATELVGTKQPQKNDNSSGTALSIRSFLSFCSASSTAMPSSIKTKYNYKKDTPQSGYSSLAFNDFMKVSNNGLHTVQAGNNAIVGQFGVSVNETSNNNSSISMGTKQKSLADLYGSAGKISGSLFLGSSPAGDKPDFSYVKDNFEAFTNMASSLLYNAFEAANLFDNDKIEKLIKQVNSNLVDKYENNINGLGTGSPTKDQSYDAMKKVGTEKGYEWDDCDSYYNENSIAMSMIAAKDLGCITATVSHKENGGDRNTWSFAVDAGQYVKELIDAVFSTLTGGKSQTTDYNSKKTTDIYSEFNIVSSYLKTEETPDNDADKTDVNKNQANYYAKLFDNLSSSGWVINDDVTDKSKLNELLTNQTYFVNGTNINNTDSELYEEDTSTDNTAKAEAYWKVEMQKISTKEKKLETELSKLQTEYSSLTSDIESVKSIITQNISKSFTYCQNG